MFTLRHEGVPSLRGSKRGDMVVELQVLTPVNLCDEQKELLEKFDDLCREHGHHKEQEGFFSRLFNEVLGKKGKEEE
jgi:molecular chaperone DnaJ